MTQMTLTADSYADLKPFETMAKKFGVEFELKEKRTLPDIRKFNNMCKEARKFAKETGLTQADISNEIKKARAENANYY